MSTVKMTVTRPVPMGISIPFFEGPISTKVQLQPPTHAAVQTHTHANHQNRKTGSADGERVLASRFRTKLCANYVDNGGWCPYESRCMFAHGEQELRTAEMNLRDGLVTEEAIKAFKRFLHLRRMGIEVLPPSHAVHWADAAVPLSSTPQPDPVRLQSVAGAKLHAVTLQEASSSPVPSSDAHQTRWYRWCPYSTSNSVVYFDDLSDRSSHQSAHDIDHDHRSTHSAEFDHTDESASEPSSTASPTKASSAQDFPHVGRLDSFYEI